MDRRAFLSLAGAGLAVLTPEQVFARSAAANPDWALALGDIEADLPVRALRRIHGRAPKGLAGALYRNGPAKFRRPGGNAGHWFDGDGLVRAFRIDGDRATLEGRFVDTAKRRQDEKFGAMVSGGFGTLSRPDAIVESSDDSNCANTALLPIGGELLALWEVGSPYAVNPATLKTKGLKTFRPDLAHMPFLAHPRIEPNGRVWNLGLAGRNAIVWTLDPAGGLEKAQVIQLPRASYMHDFTATERYLVLVMQPWVHDKQVMPFAASLSWRPEMGTQVLVVDKDDLSKRRTYELPPFFAFHLSDAWEDRDGTIRFDACTDPDPTFAQQGATDLVAFRKPVNKTSLASITLRPDGKADYQLTALAAEFPKADARFAGKPRSRTVVNTVNSSGGTPFLQGVAVTDWRTGKADVFDYGPGHVAEELLFVPRPGSSRELDGWLVGTSINLKARATELHVFDADRVADGPLCTWRADVGLPMGFHGCWIG